MVDEHNQSMLFVFQRITSCTLQLLQSSESIVLFPVLKLIHNFARVVAQLVVLSAFRLSRTSGYSSVISAFCQSRKCLAVVSFLFLVGSLNFCCGATFQYYLSFRV